MTSTRSRNLLSINRECAITFDSAWRWDDLRGFLLHRHGIPFSFRVNPLWF